MVTLKSTAAPVTVPEGTSIMRAASLAGVTSRAYAPPNIWKPSARAVCV